jgi:hypothetical protein
MSNLDHFKKYLGQERYYHDFLIFWQTEMDKRDWQSVLNEYLFAGDERADELLTRMFAGWLFVSLLARIPMALDHLLQNDHLLP